MPKKTVLNFSIENIQVLYESGNADMKLMPKVTNEEIKKFYEDMILIRAFDKKCLSLQRQGRLGTYAMLTGQEASQVGSANALSKEDWMFPTYRESGAMISRGMPLLTLLQYWAGDERGQHIPEGENDFTVSIPIASQIPHAVGLAWSLKAKGKKNASLVYFGDGATSKGDFHEGMNFAGALNLPVVFICQNNHFAISLPTKKQTAAQSMAQKAIAYGIPSIQVDGNDVFAVYLTTKHALEKAYAGNGPSFIECLTYRVCDHTTSDDASRYRPKEEVEEWKKKDPVERLRKFMEQKGLWTKDYETKIQEQSAAKVEEAVKQLEEFPEQKVNDLFNYVFAEMTPQLKEQLEYLKGFDNNK